MRRYEILILRGKHSMKKVLIQLGFHGKRHKVSKTYLDVKSYNKNQKIRDEKTLKWMHDQGLGA